MERDRGSSDLGRLLDAAAALPGTEDLADRAMELSENATEAEALKLGATLRGAMLDVLEAAILRDAPTDEASVRRRVREAIEGALEGVEEAGG